MANDGKKFTDENECRKYEEAKTKVEDLKTQILALNKELACAEYIMYGKGISKEGDILDLAACLDIVNKSGAWYAYKGDKIGQGRENAKQYLAQNPLICEEIENKVRELHGLEAQHLAVAAEAPAED